jgi:cellulose synthase (UDP-forming)
VYDTAFCFPGLRRLWLVLRRPFTKASKVTRKGVKAEGKTYNLRLTMPLLIVLGLTIAIIAIYLLGYFGGLWLVMPIGSGVTFFWLLYNAVLMMVAVLSSIDQPVRRASDRFPLQTLCKLTEENQPGSSYWGHTENVSDTGALITLTSEATITSPTVRLDLVEHGFGVEAAVVRVGQMGQHTTVALKFVRVSIAQNRHLVKLLYGTMTWWKQGKRAGGFDALLALLAAVVRFRPLLNTYR